MAQHEIKTAGDILWKNVNYCLDYYEYNKTRLAKLICISRELESDKKNVHKVAKSIGRFSKNNTIPDNTWLADIRDAIRVIDTENSEFPVEYRDLFTEEFFKW